MLHACRKLCVHLLSWRSAGTTLHSQTGCGVPKTKEDFGRMFRKEVRERWRALKVGSVSHPVDTSARLSKSEQAAANRLNAVVVTIATAFVALSLDMKPRQQVPWRFIAVC